VQPPGCVDIAATGSGKYATISITKLPKAQQSFLRGFRDWSTLSATLFEILATADANKKRPLPLHEPHAAAAAAAAPPPVKKPTPGPIFIDLT
jgi:hypothetical protein